MPSNPTLTRTSGITFMVMPPASPPPPSGTSFLLDDLGNILATDTGDRLLAVPTSS